MPRKEEIERKKKKEAEQKKIDYLVNLLTIKDKKRKVGRPSKEEEFEALAGLPIKTAKELIDSLLKEAIEKHHNEETDLEDVRAFINRAIYPLLYSLIKRGLLGDAQLSRYIIDKVVPDAKDAGEGETIPKVTIVLEDGKKGKKEKIIDVTPA